MTGQNWPQNHHNETLGVKNALKCFTRKITKGYLRKLHKITITSDSIKIIFGLNWIPRKFWFSNFFDFQAEIVIFEWKSQKFKQLSDFCEFTLYTGIIFQII